MTDKATRYEEVVRAIEAIVAGETDGISVMSSIACEIFHAFDYFNWVGFYRRVDERTLKVGPYQGTHGCLTIDIGEGVCGACVRAAAVQLENDVSLVPAHIACSEATKAEIVLPIIDARGYVVAVMDIDSTVAGVFDEQDVRYLEHICRLVPTAT